MPVPAEILSRLEVWNSSALNYTIVGIALLTASILSSAVVTVFTEQLEKKWLKACGFIATVATALIATFNPMDVGYRFREAWSILDSAILHYKTDENKFPISTVVEAMDKGQALISGASKPSVKPAESPTAPK